MQLLDANAISRPGKATGKHKNERNVKLGENSIKQIGFDRDIASFEIAASIETNIQQQPQETLLHSTLLYN